MITLKDTDPQMIENNTMPSEPVHPGLLLKAFNIEIIN